MLQADIANYAALPPMSVAPIRDSHSVGTKAKHRRKYVFTAQLDERVSLSYVPGGVRRAEREEESSPDNRAVFITRVAILTAKSAQCWIPILRLTLSQHDVGESRFHFLKFTCINNVLISGGQI